MIPSPSKLIRRVHMYLALFLTPWMAIYALSGFVLNHFEAVRSLYGGKYPDFEKVAERPYSTTFSADADARMIGAHILDDLGLAGSFNVNPASNATRLVLMRSAMFTAHRVTYFRAENRLLIERQALAAPVAVNRAHFRHGYEQPYPAAKLWGFVVDLAIAGMLFWVASGIWMWWEIRPARSWGAACLLLGCGAFAVMLVVI